MLQFHRRNDADGDDDIGGVKAATTHKSFKFEAFHYSMSGSLLFSSLNLRADLNIDTLTYTVGHMTCKVGRWNARANSGIVKQ
jgi:hypothetical protein